jgi:nucleoside-diphosphate-sugar epimerase
MRVLVTGGGGFIGGALVRQLLTMGYKVASFSRGDYPELGEAGVEAIRGDLADPEALTRACANRDIVFHTAALAGVWGPYRDYYLANVKGTENLVNACLTQGVNRLIFTGSASVVFGGTGIEGGDESLPYPSRPLSHYTATKALSESCVLEANSPKLKTLSLRPHVVWGPGDRHIIPRIIKLARSGKLRRIGNGCHLVDTTYITNAVSAHLCAAEAMARHPAVAGRAYFISNGEPTPIWDFVDRILGAAGLSPVRAAVSPRVALLAAGILESIYNILGIKSEPRLTRFVVRELCTAHWFDLSAARTLLGYVPRVSIQEGLERLAAWFRQPGPGQGRCP